jgi:hypothetical protein
MPKSVHKDLNITYNSIVKVSQDKDLSTNETINQLLIESLSKYK